MTLKGQKAVICGGGGFIGGHLVKHLLAQGVDVIRSVDIKPLDEWYQTTSDVENLSLDLKDKANCLRAADGADVIFQLAADMGGMGFIENNKALCMLSVLTNTHMLMAARDKGVGRFFFSSSACVYNADKQTNPDVVALKEEDAYPAMPKTAMDGRSSFPSACAVTSAKTTVSKPAWPGITTFTGRSGRGRVAARRHLPRSAARCSKRR